MKTLEDKITTIVIILIIFILLVALNSCSPQLFKNNKKINITHVLAVTEMGDTLKIPIEAIRPNVIYNVMGYSYGMRPSYYYRPYNYGYDYYPYNYGNNNNNNVNYSVPSKPTTSIPTPSSSGNFGGPSGTSGFSGNPTAVNPVTSGGGAKKKNN